MSAWPTTIRTVTASSIRPRTGAASAWRSRCCRCSGPIRTSPRKPSYSFRTRRTWPGAGWSPPKVNDIPDKYIRERRRFAGILPFINTRKCARLGLLKIDIDIVWVCEKDQGQLKSLPERKSSGGWPIKTDIARTQSTGDSLKWRGRRESESKPHLCPIEGRQFRGTQVLSLDFYIGFPLRPR